jgi:hypothetical protein
MSALSPNVSKKACRTNATRNHGELDEIVARILVRNSIAAMQFVCQLV